MCQNHSTETIMYGVHLTQVMYSNIVLLFYSCTFFYSESILNYNNIIAIISSQAVNF